jgi:hypothetical protein
MNTKASVNIACKHENAVEGGQARDEQDELLLAASVTFAQEQEWAHLSLSNANNHFGVCKQWRRCVQLKEGFRSQLCSPCSYIPVRPSKHYGLVVLHTDLSCIVVQSQVSKEG